MTTPERLGRIRCGCLPEVAGARMWMREESRVGAPLPPATNGVDHKGHSISKIDSHWSQA